MKNKFTETIVVDGVQHYLIQSFELSTVHGRHEFEFSGLMYKFCLNFLLACMERIIGSIYCMSFQSTLMNWDRI